MLFVSHAQNYEDVMLWRALQHVQSGFYIDVGAWSPDADSVTRAFSERGWRGINIEPNAHYFRQLCERRPADINLPVALGEHSGIVAMSFIADSGLSTADEAVARRHAAAGWAVTVHEVPLTTLAAVWAEHVPDGTAVHFLKVDVEGLERAVLAGNDWKRNRPWVVVVEATFPTSQVETHGEWEHLLLNEGYLHVYADGLNRFYVALEQEALACAFKYPPNVFDGFVTADVELLRRNAERLEGAASVATQRANFAEDELMTVRRQAQVARTRAEVHAKALVKQAAVYRQQLADANQRAAHAQQNLNTVVGSGYWRLTAALRRVAPLVPLVPRPLLRQARRAAKAAWWAVTPWRIPERLRQRRQPVDDARNGALDFCSDDALVAATGLSLNEVLWIAQPGEAVIDKWSAARWCVDLVRSRPDLRARFPKPLSEGARGDFASWLLNDGARSMGLTDDAIGYVGEALGDDIAARARQYFLFRADVRVLLPHGLTPAGHAALYRWFMRNGVLEGDLRLEEVLWLFLEAAEQPSLELVRAYLFTPAWQQRHPDGLTVFGRDDFAAWFAKTNAVVGSWIDPSSWPVDISPSRQLRLAYKARHAWQALHPGALDSAQGAAALLCWLQSPSAPVTDEARAWCGGLDKPQVAKELAAGGVNLIGHFCNPSGVRVSAEALVDGMRESGVQTSLRDLRTDVKDEPNHVRYDGLEPFDITIVHTQPEPFFDEAYARSDLAERSPRTYRIAYWYWEFDSIPASWVKQADQVDEVWAATEFVAKGLRERLSIPVKTLFPGVRLGAYERRDREHFGLAQGKFIFLFNFHMNSVMERKNPLGLISAFKSVFGPGEPVSLVLKTMYGHHHPAQLKQLYDAAAGYDITVIDQMYSADEVLSLMDACDAYVSLHRSEGLGLTMAEAMLMGKPVIATNYSGNVDFMDETNSLLVPYTLVKLGRPLPPYDADLLWAEPSLEHAAVCMRRLFDAPAWARELGAKGKASAETKLSVKTAGIKVAARLDEIRALRGAMGSVYG